MYYDWRTGFEPALAPIIKDVQKVRQLLNAFLL